MYQPGDFSFFENKLWRETLTHDYACLTREDWLALRDHDSDDSFMWDTNGAVWDSIRAKMSDDHSAASMACSLRNLERIAKFGWDSCVKHFIDSQKKEEDVARVRSEFEQRRRSQVPS